MSEQSNSQQPQHLNSAQIAQVDKKIRDAVQTIVKDVALRQWAVEQTLTHCARHNDFKEVAQMFETIYGFVSKLGMPPA
jgi:hypothetical protein